MSERDRERERRRRERWREGERRGVERTVEGGREGVCVCVHEHAHVHVCTQKHTQHRRSKVSYTDKPDKTRMDVFSSTNYYLAAYV